MFLFIQIILYHTDYSSSYGSLIVVSAMSYTPRLCHIRKWPDFPGYGFNLHAEKERGGQYIGKIDDGSPAQDAGLQEGDRIIEVNGINIEDETHQQVIQRIKAGGDETKMLVVDREADAYYKQQGITVRSSISEVKFLATTPRGSGENLFIETRKIETVHKMTSSLQED